MFKFWGKTWREYNANSRDCGWIEYISKHFPSLVQKCIQTYTHIHECCMRYSACAIENVTRVCIIFWYLLGQEMSVCLMLWNHANRNKSHLFFFNMSRHSEDSPFTRTNMLKGQKQWNGRRKLWSQHWEAWVRLFPSMHYSLRPREVKA